MEWVGLVLLIGLPLAIVLGVLAGVVIDFGLWTTIQLLIACAAIAFLSAVVTLGAQQL